MEEKDTSSIPNVSGIKIQNVSTKTEDFTGPEKEIKSEFYFQYGKRQVQYARLQKHKGRKPSWCEQMV